MAVMVDLQLHTGNKLVSIFLRKTFLIDSTGKHIS